jgi:hypothetical protein
MDMTDDTPLHFTEADLAHLYARHLSRTEPPPWTAADLDPAERAAHLDLLLQWVDHLNATYAWHPAQLIPPCWPLHPGLQRELTTLYWTYYEAFETPPTSPSAAQVWHDRYLPGFQSRLPAWTTSQCQQGNHQPHPAADLLHRNSTDPTRAMTREALSTARTDCIERPAVPLSPSVNGPATHQGWLGPSVPSGQTT